MLARDPGDRWRLAYRKVPDTDGNRRRGPRSHLKPDGIFVDGRCKSRSRTEYLGLGVVFVQGVRGDGSHKKRLPEPDC